MTVPFEIVAVDLVGPLPKGRKGVKYLFTYVCLASRWSEAQPMRTASAKEAAQCQMLGTDTIATSPYRPQSNGVVERLHGSLKPMLAKAVDSGIDWADIFPLALFAQQGHRVFSQ